jgi:hypothetical protein
VLRAERTCSIDTVGRNAFPKSLLTHTIHGEIMFKSTLIIVAVTASVVACGGGSSETDSGIVFLASTPPEEVLCSFVIGETTQSEVLDELGEPTHHSEDATGAVLQYWVGSEAELGGAGPRLILFEFDAEGRLETPLVQQLPFPQCWRNQAAALDAAD